MTDKIEEIFTLKKLRITPMRQILLEYFIKENIVLGLSELEKVFPNSDRITMYRTLKTFEEKGILHCIKGEGEEARYALCNEHCTPTRHLDQHPHFQCQKCNQVKCIDNLLIPVMKLPDGYVQKDVNMMIKGICPNCQ